MQEKIRSTLLTTLTTKAKPYEVFDTDLKGFLVRVSSIIAALRLSDPGVCKRLKENLYIKSLIAENNLMTLKSRTGEVELTDYVDRLILAAKEYKHLRLIVIDPASRFRGGDENAAQDATRFVQALERLRAATGATILVVHHVNKGSRDAKEVSQNASRGSSGMTDGARWQMNLNNINDSNGRTWGLEAERHKYFLQASVTKSNYGPHHDPFLIHRGDGGVLTLIRGNKTECLLDRIVDILQTERGHERYYSATEFENKFGGENGPLKIGIVSVRKAIRSAVSDGKLKKVGTGKKLDVPTKK